MEQNEQTMIDQREARGLSWRLLVIIVGSFMTVEATILGIYFPTMGRIDQAERDLNKIDKRVDEVDKRVDALRVDIDLLKIQGARRDAQLDNLRNAQP